MIYFISIVHALTCVFIVLFVLLQDPKGGVLGSLGGGSRAFFGAEGASPFLVKVTKWLAVVFACSSFYLSYISSQKDKSVVTQELSEELTPTAPSGKPEPTSSSQEEVSPATTKNEKPNTKQTPSPTSPSQKNRGEQAPLIE